MTAPEEVVIKYTTPDYDGLGTGSQTDITSDVLFADAYFEMQSAAVPGSFHLTVKDEAQTHEFVSGGVIEAWVGGKKMFGGFVSVPTREFFFPADDTSSPVRSRRWALDGVDFNHLLDKRILRDPSKYTDFIDKVTNASGNNNDRDIIGLFANYFDLDFSGGNSLDVTSAKVQSVNDFSQQALTGTVSKTNGSIHVYGSGTIFGDELGINDTISIPGGGGTDEIKVLEVVSDTHLKMKEAPTHTASGQSAVRIGKAFKWPTQGVTMRDTLDALVIETTIHGNNACIYWVDANAQLNWMALEDTYANWGFSDVPSGPAYDEEGTQIYIPFIGWRDGSAVEDGSSVINEVFVWGGSALGSAGDVVMAHRPRNGFPAAATASIAAHGRWQMAEVHPGEDNYKSQRQVNARANALIKGNTSGSSPATGAQGLVNPDTQYTLTWFANDVPLDGGVRQHLVAGDVVTLNLWSFSEDGGQRPYAIKVPLRQVRITFPTLPSDNPLEDPLAYVQFQGTFGLQMADPVWWWAFLRKRRPEAQPAPIITTDDTSATYPYGSYFTGSAQEAPDGSRVLFSIKPTYQPGTLEVYLNQILQTSGWSETSPSEETGGTFTFDVAPVSTDTITCRCRTG